MIFEEGAIEVWAYNIETVLAEKVETILRRGELNTRPRDFYDIYVLTKTQNLDDLVFREALRNTATHRETTHILSDIDKRIEDLEKSNTLKLRWIKYTKDYRYAEDITYDNVIEALRVLKATLKFGPKIKS